MKQISLIVTILLFSLTAQTQIITDGLIGYWPFNGNAKDESISMNDGIVSGASLTTDRFGAPNSAYSFDGMEIISILVMIVPYFHQVFQ